MRTRSLAAIAAAGTLAAGGLLVAVPTAMAKPTGNGVRVAAAAAPRWRDASPHPALAGGPGPVSCARPRWCLAEGQFGPQADDGSVTWNGTRWSSRATLIAGAQNGDQLTDVSCPKVNFCMGIGATAGYAALAERWNGSRWIAEKTPKPAAQLTAVSCPSPTSCTAIGLYVSNQTGRTLAEHWNGRRWTIQPTASRIFSGSFPSMSCASARSCVAVADGTKRMFAEVWNGTRWTYRVIHPPAGALAAGVGGVSCSSPDACTAVGYYSNGRGIAVPLAERWNGKSWRTMLPAVPGSDSGLEVVSCASARSCVATGSRFVQAGEQSFAEVWTGGKWFVHELRPPEDPDYFPHASVSCARSTAVSCMAVGHSELPSMYMWAEHYS